MARQAAAFRAARPDITKPVQHFTLNFQAADGRRSPEELKPIVEAFLKKMGFPLDGAWASFVHNDTDYQHVHVVFERSLGNGQIWSNANSAKRAIRISAELEKEFGLTPTDHTSKRERRRQAVTEKKFEAQLKGKTMSKQHIARQVDDFIESRRGQTYSLDELKSGLSEAGIQVEFTERGGQLAGVKFQHEGIWISGSNIGDNYKAQGLLQRGLTPGSDTAAPVQAVPVLGQKASGEKDGQAQENDTPAQVRQHNQRAATAGEMLAKGLALPVEAMVKLIQMIIKMLNRLFGRREEANGAPSGVLGRFSERTGRFEPGAFPAKNDPGHGKALAAVGAAAGDVSALAQHAGSGKQWSELIEHGAAPYKNQDGAAQSYFARLRLPGGKETEVWGVDIARALEDAGVEVGDKVYLQRDGQKAVTVKQREADGTFKEIHTHRNAWRAEKPEEEVAQPAGDLGQAKLLAEAQAELAALRDSAIRFLRDKSEFAALAFGANGAEHLAAMAELSKVGFGPADEIKYQAWRESPAAQPLDRESATDYIRRREIEYLRDQLEFHDRFKVGMSQDELRQKTERLAELREMQGDVEGETASQRERKSS